MANGNKAAQPVTAQQVNRLLRSIEAESDNEWYRPSVYSTTFMRILSESEYLKAASALQTILNHPLVKQLTFGVTAMEYKHAYVIQYGPVAWAKLRLTCATAATKKRKKK